ncbi:MAG: RnfABCDGE type electron transport complex subunit B [Burkholderiales bacterium]|nr:RnfABCDGE type electron transport complex subunit B [Burkholderiales bacterium]
MITAAPADAIDSLLPQTQCGQCDYPGCRPYAEAIASGSAAINQCPPGGNELITELAALLDVPVMPLSASHGATAAPAIAIIDETVCIGCALCLPACPVDAIVGARRLMHTVIAAECTGCGLCLPPCPVNCISIRPTGAPRDHAAQRAASGRLRQRFLAHQQRLSTRGHERHGKKNGVAADAAARKRATLDRALSRARARLAKNTA